MNFHNLKNTAMGMWRDARKRDRKLVTLTVLGPPGVGKTACGAAIADAMTADVQGRNPTAPPAVFKSLDLSSMLPEDLMGLPDTKSIDPSTGERVTRYIPQSWMAPLCAEGAYGVLVQQPPFADTGSG